MAQLTLKEFAEKNPRVMTVTKRYIFVDLYPTCFVLDKREVEKKLRKLVDEFKKQKKRRWSVWGIGSETCFTVKFPKGLDDSARKEILEFIGNFKVLKHEWFEWFEKRRNKRGSF